MSKSAIVAHGSASYNFLLLKLFIIVTLLPM